MIGRHIITMACYACLIHAKPIMVSFGTKGGPIVPPTPSTTTLNPLAPKNPAPVFEQVDDIPPPVYRPPTPNQYRNQISEYRPNPNLQLGTPLDIKYQSVNTLSQLQVQQQKADYARQQGLAYNGAQVFNVQAYEYDNAKNRQQQVQGQAQGQSANKLSSAQQFVQQYVAKPEATTVQPAQEQKNLVRQQRHQDKDQAVQGSTRYTNVYSVREVQAQPEPQLAQQYHYQYNHHNQQNNNHFNYQHSQHGNNYQNQDQNQLQNQVPGIGIAYSSGLRYYVPQFYYYDSRQQQQQQQQQPQSQYQQFKYNHKRFNEVGDNAIYGQ